MNNKKKFWSCVIGPISEDKVPFGADFPLRNAVNRIWLQMFEEPAEIHSSGWSMDEEKRDLLQTISHMDNADIRKMLTNFKTKPKNETFKYS